MTDKCEHCKGTRKEPGFDFCTWCDNTGLKGGKQLFAAPAAVVAAVTDAAIHGTGVMLLNPAEGAEHVPLADILVNLKPFRSLPYGTRFRYQGTKDAWVRTSHNIVAEWPGRLRTPTNEPIQSLCSFCHLDGDEDGNTLDTLVEVVDQDAELAALREELAGVVAEKVGLQEWVDNLKHDLTAAEQRNASIVGKVTHCKECGSDDLFWFAQNTVHSGIQHNRLNTNDVTCLLVLGCNNCSETLMTVSADKIAGRMTSALKPTESGATNA